MLTPVNSDSLSDNWVFYAFAIPAVLAAVLTVLVPTSPRRDPVERTHAPAVAEPRA
ncbi:aromatic acid/H+ symport family MFS transporter [Streptomyces sp. TP-A0874]|uniref:aromatic acid/H+ symport family MFS transporter n=1 Tax=Streptomyces sp. TP-A0874 TaxID=549819 RepID=UPI001112EA01|nr:aromatic acid/H+ symport family MFS transporter [Streptomyces sp. TP-A0874]